MINPQIKNEISIQKQLWSGNTNLCSAGVHGWVVCYCVIVKITNPIKYEMHNIWPLICFSRSFVTAVFLLLAGGLF